MNVDYTSIPLEHLPILADITRSTFSSAQGVHHTYLLARDVSKRKVSGAFVECGVANGGQIGSMALALESMCDTRPIHLFDSFEGIPLAGPNDHDQPGIGHYIADVNLPLEQRLISSKISAASIDNVKKNLNKWGFNPEASQFVWHKGWFQHTLPTAQVGPIALLRLDGDLYESTAVCLQWLYHHVQPGGVVIIDDYPLPGCRKAVDEFLAANNLHPDIKQDVDCGIAAWTV